MRAVLSATVSLGLLAGLAVVVSVPASAAAPAWAGHGHLLSAAAERVVYIRTHPAEAARPAINSGTPCKAETSTTGNVQVNCRAEDGTSSQNTQSETSVAVAGTKVVVGFNDSLVCCTALNLSGYSVSKDGGKTFMDMGDLPWKPTVQPLGDPALATDPAGNIYYASLAYSSASSTAHSLLALYKMAAGSSKFTLMSIPVDVGSATFFFADKEYLAIGVDGAGKVHFYITWTYFSTAVASPIKLTDSTDGLTWTTTTVSSAAACAQGSNPVPAGGTLYVSWFQQTPTACSAGGFTSNVMMATVAVSTHTVTKTTTVAAIKGSGDKTVACNSASDIREVIETSVGHDIRNFEMPSTTMDANGFLYAVWNDRTAGIGGSNSNSTKIFLSYSKDGNMTWSAPKKISGATSATAMLDRFQPWVTADATGLHAMWYHRVAGVASPDMIQTDREDLTLATTTTPPVAGPEKKVSSVTFPIVMTNPNQDPIISNCYMGDYNNIVSSGGKRYITWGDNRIVSTSPAENQPDVFLQVV
jgi:hypothetical protein